MKINKAASAGTLESNDILIMVAPNEEEAIEIQLDSIVMKQFGEEIEGVIRQVLQELSITSVKLRAQDKGALNYTVRARVEAACRRGV